MRKAFLFKWCCMIFETNNLDVSKRATGGEIWAWWSGGRGVPK